MFVAAVVGLVAPVAAQGTATEVSTAGVGEFVRKSEASAGGSGRYGAIAIPTRVSIGDVFAIRYPAAGGMITDSFAVTGLRVDGETCTLESKHQGIPGALPDTITTGCRKLR